MQEQEQEQEGPLAGKGNRTAAAAAAAVVLSSLSPLTNRSPRCVVLWAGCVSTVVLTGLAPSGAKDERQWRTRLPGELVSPCLLLAPFTPSSCHRVRSWPFRAPVRQGGKVLMSLPTPAQGAKQQMRWNATAVGTAEMRLAGTLRHTSTICTWMVAKMSAPLAISSCRCRPTDEAPRAVTMAGGARAN